MNTRDYNDLKRHRCRKVGHRYQFCRLEDGDWDDKNDVRLRFEDAKKHAKNMWLFRPLSSGVFCTGDDVDLFFEILKQEEKINA